MLSDWNYFKETIKFRTLAIMPESRYWISENNDGFFAGAHFGLAYYNFAFNGKYRYQDHLRQTLDVDLNADQKIADDEKFRYLSMSYILVNDAKDGASKANLSVLQFTFKPENGNEILFTEGVANVPVQRNWRTNIVGQILTGTIDFEVMIDKEYLGDYNS